MVVASLPGSWTLLVATGMSGIVLPMFPSSPILLPAMVCAACSQHRSLHCQLIVNWTRSVPRNCALKSDCFLPVNQLFYSEFSIASVIACTASAVVVIEESLFESIAVMSDRA